MKRILTLAACAALCTSTLLADIKIGDTTYPTLQAAVDVAAETDVITVSGEYTQSGRLNINNPVTITGTDNAVIKATDTKNIVILVVKGSQGALKMSNITIDGDGQTWDNKNLMEINTAGNELTNVTFRNAGTTHNGGVMRAVDKSRVILENVTVENCTVNEGRGEFFCGNDDAITVKGENNFKSIFIEKQLHIKAENPTNATPITIYLENRTSGNVVTGCTDLSQFNFIGCAEGYEVDVVEGNLAVQKATYVAEFNGNQYKSFNAAYSIAKENTEVSELTLIDDAEIGTRFELTIANFTIKGKTGNEKLIKSVTNSQMFLVKGVTTFENLIIDFNNISVSTSQEGQIEAGDRNLNLSNILITGVPEDGKHAIYAKAQRRVTLNNVTGNASILLKHNGTNGANATISGDNSISFTMENAANQITVADEGITNTTPIDITYTDAAGVSSDNVPDNTVVVKNCTDPKLFNITNEGLTLAAKDGNLILAKKVSSGVENVMTEDADAPVEWFNLQGIRVANPENGIYIRRQGSKVEKVVL